MIECSSRYETVSPYRHADWRWRHSAPHHTEGQSAEVWQEWRWSLLWGAANFHCVQMTHTDHCCFYRYITAPNHRLHYTMAQQSLVKVCPMRGLLWRQAAVALSFWVGNGERDCTHVAALPLSDLFVHLVGKLLYGPGGDLWMTVASSASSDNRKLPRGAWEVKCASKDGFWW